MRLRLAALVFGLSSASALAATCPNALPPNTIAPASIGRAHSCPNYPLLAWVLGEQGKVQLEFTIGTDGRVRHPNILESSGFSNLDQAAVACASNFVYIPAKKNGKAVEVPWRITIAYCFEGGCPIPTMQIRGGKPPPPRRAPTKTKTPRNCVPLASRGRASVV